MCAKIAYPVERVRSGLPGDDAQCAHSVRRLAVAAEQENATPFANRELRSLELVEAAGIEPASENDPTQIYYVRSQSIVSSPVAPTDRILGEPVQ